MYCFRAPRLVAAIAAVGVLFLVVIPANVGAQSSYPPNTVVSTYNDVRYCGGPIAVVSDSGGNLIDVCTTTGARIDPVALPYGAPGYAYGYAPGYGAGAIPPYTIGSVPPVYSAAGTTNVIRQYTDNNANCPNGAVTQTLSGFFCTVNGQPATSNLSLPAFTGGYAPYAPATPGYGPGYSGVASGPVGNGAIIRQYNDGRSNCPNGDVTETTGGFFCTASGQPAFRAN
ncbi:MAG: hypothetical protein M3Y58_03455 [Chloroflexota bacterium]|nr:hypothetical protein [Chloroflexota bacterium]